MNYFPFFRGKQYELICIRENAALIAAQSYVPIIEPVREQISGLSRALDALVENGASFLVLGNPSVGHHSETLSQEARKVVDDRLAGYPKGGWLFQTKSRQDVSEVSEWLASNRRSSLLHSGLTDGKELAAALAIVGNAPQRHIFTSSCSKAYQRNFGGDKVMIADGFRKQRNADYPDDELFSDLNVTFAEDGFSGFGDYLIVGNEYSESGGPAYAVTIHITYLDPDNDGGIYVRHFISDERDTQTDPAGKFRQAVKHLADACTASGTKIRQTDAIGEFLKLHKTGHFPGLGYVKKLSMQHHLELLAE